MLKYIVHRFLKGVIILAGICIILLVPLYLLRGALIGPQIQRLLESSIKSQLGMEVAIGDIGGSYFTDVEVTNVTTLQPAPVQKLVSLELKRMRMSYNLLTILEGLNAFLGNAAFEVDTAELEFDLTRQNTRESAPPVLLISMETFGSMATNCWWNRFKPIPDRVNPTFEFLVDNVKKSLRKRL